MTTSIVRTTRDLGHRATAGRVGGAWPVSAVDAMWGDASVVIAVGPLAVPDRADLVAGVRRLAEYGDATRLDWTPPTHARRPRWSRTADLDARAEATVVDLAVRAGEPIHETLTRASALGYAGLPMRLFVCGDTVLLSIAHATGDGFFMTRMLAAIVSTAVTGEVPAWAREPVTTHPLARALRAFFGTEPSRLVPLARLALGGPAGAAATPAPTPAPTAVVGDRSAEVAWRPSPTCRFASSTRPAFAELKVWRKAHAPGLSTVPLTVAAAHLALARLGATPTTPPLMLFDARRYLGADGARVSGNFCAGLRLHVADPGDAVELHAKTVEATALGRPLGALTMATLGSRRRTRGDAPGVMRTGTPIGSPDAAYTHMARPVEIVRLPWKDADGEARFFTGMLTPGDAAGLTFAFSEIGNRINASASFHDNAIAPALVQEALSLLCADPAGLLEEHRLRGGSMIEAGTS